MHLTKQVKIGIVRTACNRAIYALSPADAHGNRQYGDKAPAPKAWLKERKGFQRRDVMVRGYPGFRQNLSTKLPLSLTSKSQTQG